MSAAAAVRGRFAATEADRRSGRTSDVALKQLASFVVAGAWLTFVLL
jgi:hypothetical protein